MSSSVAIAASFGRAAAGYREHALIQQRAADWLAEWAPALPARTGNALELGAGTGLFTERMLPWAGRLLATDLSAEMCAEGERRLPHVEWQAAAAESPPFGPWDWIFSSSMLQWVAEPPAVLARWREQLARHGRILGGMFVAPTLPEWHALVTDPAPVQWRSPGEWTAAVHAAGLRLVRAETQTYRCEYSSAVAFLRSLHAVGAAPARRIAPQRLRPLLREYDRRYRVESGERTGCSPVRSTWTFFRFEATR